MTSLMLLAADAATTPTTPISQQGGLLEPFIRYALPLLLTAVTFLVGLALTAAAAKFKAQAEKDSAAHKAISAAAFLARMTALAQSAFTTVDMAMRPKILAASADGRITPEELASLRRDATDLLKAWVGENAKAEASALIGILTSGFDTWLGALIATQSAGGAPTTGGTTIVVP